MSLRPYLLGAVALALAAAVVWDYWPPGPALTPATAPAVTKPAVAAPLNPLSQRPEADFAALFDHPLFDPTRTKATPQPLPEAAFPTQTAASAPVAAGPAQPVLMGTVTSPWPGGVYLGDDQGGPVVFLRPGDAALGLHLEEARPDSALFMGPDGEVILTLHKADPTVGPVPEGQGSGIPATGVPDPAAGDPTQSDPNAPVMGAMAPGAVDPSATDLNAESPVLVPVPGASARRMPSVP